MLGLGLGRAILFLREHDARPYRDIILDACVHWTGYDQQVEGTRTPYLMTVLDETGQIGSYVEPILAAFRASTDRRDQQQLIRLASELAQEGYAEARDALYERFDRNDTIEPYSCAFELVRIDGVEGLLHVAERMGATLLDDPGGLGDDDWILSSTVRDAEEDFGKDAVQQILGGAAGDDPRVRAYVQAVEAIESEERAQRAALAASRADASARRAAGRAMSYERVKRAIVEREPPSVSLMGFRYWGRDASDDDLLLAATDLLAVQDEDHLSKYLQIFCLRRFPLAIDPLLALVRQPSDQVAHGAAVALSQIADPRVRPLAFEVIADPRLSGWRRSSGVSMLRSNLEPGDEALLTSLLTTTRDADELHWTSMGTLDVLKANPSADAVPILLALYEHGPCTRCRKKSVELLRQLGVLPDWMLEECRFDAGEYLREAAEAWARGEEPAED